MNSLYDRKNLDFNALYKLPGFAYVKNKNSEYVWTNRHLSFVATGSDLENAMEGYTDYDFHWTDCADGMRDNDESVIATLSDVHAMEDSQASDGQFKKLITYKFPLLYYGELFGVIGFSFELPCYPARKKLTDRESACVALLSNGFSDKKIADVLSISPRTVETHINSSKLKFNVKSRAELIVKFHIG